MAFQGLQLNKKTEALDDCSVKLFCLKCKSPRYTKCSHKSCKNVPYENCDPHNKGHSIKYRVPMKNVFYRSLIGKLIELFCLSHMPGHENLLNYRERRIRQKGRIIDIHDGTKVKEAYRCMDERYERANKLFMEKYPDKGALKKCTLTYTFYLDGVTNHKRKSESMWPLFVSVADCNPHFRTKLGTGLFLVALYNLKNSSGAEKHVLDEMFVEEVKALEHGLMIEIPTQDGWEKQHVFLQARCVFTHLDTKAMEKFIRLKLSNSTVGCMLCGQQPGYYRLRLHKNVYTNTRRWLPYNHLLRFLGQRDFKNAEESNTYFDVGNEQGAADMLARCNDAQMVDSAYMPVDYVTNHKAKFSKCRTATDTFWCNSLFPYSMFKNKLRYPYPDTRPFLEYRRVTTEEYTDLGLESRYEQYNVTWLFANI